MLVYAIIICSCSLVSSSYVSKMEGKLSFPEICVCVFLRDWRVLSNELSKFMIKSNKKGRTSNKHSKLSSDFTLQRPITRSIIRDHNINPLKFKCLCWIIVLVQGNISLSRQIKEYPNEYHQFIL